MFIRFTHTKPANHIILIRSPSVFFYQLLHGLVEIPKAGLIHRDLKSLNILLADSSSSAGASGLVRCKVSDFGMTRANARGYAANPPPLRSD